MTATADVATLIRRSFRRSPGGRAETGLRSTCPPDQVLAVLQALRDAGGFDMLVDVTAIDWGAGQTPRFTVV